MSVAPARYKSARVMWGILYALGAVLFAGALLALAVIVFAIIARGRPIQQEAAFIALGCLGGVFYGLTMMAASDVVFALLDTARHTEAIAQLMQTQLRLLERPAAPPASLAPRQP